MTTFGQFQIVEEDKELLLSRVNQLVFVDGVAGFECGRCDRILIRHYRANCGHYFCANCKRVITVSKSNCPLAHCKKPIEDIDFQDIEFERKLYDLRAHCPNKSYGCPFVSQLKHLGGHLRVCKDTRDNALPVLIEDNRVEMILRQLSSKFDKLSADVTAIKVETNKIDKGLKDLETKVENKMKRIEVQMDNRVAEIKEVVDNKMKNIETEVDNKMRTTEIKVNNNSGKIKLEFENKMQDIETKVDKNSTNMKTEVNNKIKHIETEVDNKVKNIKTEVNNKMKHIETEVDLKVKNMQTEVNIEVNHIKTEIENKVAEMIKKEYNVLLMGERGLGKSTFINNLATYLKFEDFNAAKMANLDVPIPYHATVTGSKYRYIFDSDNENVDSGTQKCKEHLISYKDAVIRIFDTPGIGDRRGIDQDKLNLKDTMETLSKYEDLHCVCIFLQPDEFNLTTTFEFCIKEILCQIHKSAINNIVFIIASTFYSLMPGGTVKLILNNIRSRPPFLEIPFNENNVFFLNSDVFHFLLACKQSVAFSNRQEQEFRLAWVKLVEKYKRLIQHIVNDENGIGMVPHKIEETVRLNRVRKTFFDIITRPPSQLAHYTHEEEEQNLTKCIDFLKQNAIVTYNDVVQIYLSHLIYNAESSSKVGSNNQQEIKELKTMMKNYSKVQEICKRHF